MYPSPHEKNQRSWDLMSALTMHTTGNQSAYAAVCSAYMCILLCGQHSYELPYKSYMYICIGAPGVTFHEYVEW